MTSTIANVAGKTYLCTVEIQESVHGSPCRFRLHYKKDQIESHLLAVGTRAFFNRRPDLGWQSACWQIPLRQPCGDMPPTRRKSL